MLKKDDIIVIENNDGVLRKGFFCEYVNDKEAVVEVWVGGVIPCHCILETDKIYKAVKDITVDNDFTSKINTIKKDIEQLLSVLPEEFILPNGYDLVKALKCIKSEVKE